MRLKDVSEGGACFISSLDLPAETRVRLQMEHEAAWAATEAVVVRSVSRADGFFDVSIRFILDHQKDFRARFPNRGRVRMTLL